MRALLLALCALLAASPAYAGFCAPAGQIEARLHALGEAPIGTGLGSNPVMMLQLWTNEDRSTWTITVTNIQRGITCAEADGNSWVEQDYVDPRGEDG